MICPKCGKELNEQGICDCSMNIDNKTSNKKSKKLSIIIVIILVLALLTGIGMKVYNYFNVNETLKWNEMYEAYNIENINPVEVLLGIEFSNEDGLKNVEYIVNCGKYEKNGYEVVWNLKDASGKCTIKAKYKSKEISKTFNVFKELDNEVLKGVEITIDMDSDEDLDNDGLTNKQEKEYNTDPNLSDTDLDGLTDYYEIFTSKTDPNKADSDSDGLSDYSEVKLKLDPNKSDSLNDGIKDGNRKFDYSYEKNNIKAVISGTGNIADTEFKIYEDTKISDKKGTINKLYSFETNGKIENASITIPYTKEDITKYNLNEENLSLYYFNTDTGSYEKVETIVDTVNKTISANLNHFSYYVVSSEELDKLANQIQILFVLDNSWSMYSPEQIEKYIGERYDDKDIGYDPDGLRFKLTKDMITKFSDEKYKIGLSEFRYDYANAHKIGSNKNDMISTLSNMTGKFITKDAGTNITNAIEKGLKEFDDVGEKYIVILTDGNDDSLAKERNDIIQDALAKDVHICSIGFGGSDNDSELKAISTSTGCKYYSSSNANGLNELFDSLKTEINNDLVDLNNDGKTDSILLASTNFVVNRDGFSFKNYVTNYASGGHCHGMALFAELYYMNMLPSKIDTIYDNEEKQPQSNVADLDIEFFNKHNNLYDYKFKTKELVYDGHLSSNFSKEERETLGAKYNMEGKNAVYDPEYKEIIENAGFYDIRLLNCKGCDYDKYEEVHINEDKMQESKMDNDDKQLLNAIYALYLTQYNISSYHSGYSLGDAFLIGGQKIFNSIVPGTPGSILYDGFVDLLIYRLKNDDPAVIGGDFAGGEHAINALAIYKDVEKVGLYHIKVYDNNHPGETRYVDLKCSGESCRLEPNEYYSGTSSIKMDLSINDTLDVIKHSTSKHEKGGHSF